MHKKRAKLLKKFDIYKFICTFAGKLLKMILGLLISILSATYTVASSTSVSVSGEVPKGSEVVYSRTDTGQKDRITGGNTVRLQLHGWDGCIVDSLVLQMHSNKSAGAGSLTVQIGERMVWEIPDTDFANVAWYGSFTTQWVEISRWIGANVQNSDVIEIVIEASKNSLYIGSYTLYYHYPDPVRHTVHMESGLKENWTLIEDSIGSGVVLPHGCDTLAWRFVGWSEKELMDSDVCPHVFMSGERYYPKSDCTLWAVYSDGEGMCATRDVVSGNYVLGSGFWQRCMVGGVQDGYVVTREVSLREDTAGGYEWLDEVRDEMVYYVDVLTDSTLVIECVKTDERISYQGNELADTEAVWLYKILEDGSLGMYYRDGTHCRMLYVGIYNGSDDVVAFAMRVEPDRMHNNGVLLFPIKERRFTSWPLGKWDGVEDVICGDEKERVYQWGIYELHVKNGKKSLRLLHM